MDTKALRARGEVLVGLFHSLVFRNKKLIGQNGSPPVVGCSALSAMNSNYTPSGSLCFT